MAVWLGQFCINVADLDRAVAFYESLGLTCTSRTDIPTAREAIVEQAGAGNKLQLAQQVTQQLAPSPAGGGEPIEPLGPIAPGNALWKLYVNTDDLIVTHAAALAAGAVEVSAPVRLERWPVSIAFVRDPDGHLVELVQRHPWPEGSTGVWLGQCCLNVTDLDRAVAFYEALGLTCTSRTEIPDAFEAIVEAPGTGGTLQLARQKDRASPIDMGDAFWKLYVHTDDIATAHAAALAAGAVEERGPERLDRWPVTISFVREADGYLVELVQRHPD